jgi:hypothetical protein
MMDNTAVKKLYVDESLIFLNELDVIRRDNIIKCLGVTYDDGSLSSWKESMVILAKGNTL